MQETHRIQLFTARAGQFTEIVRTTIFAQLAIAALLCFGQSIPVLPMVIITIAVTLFGVLGGNAALDDVAALRDDMDTPTAETAYGRIAGSRNIGLLKTMSAMLIGLTGLAELLAIIL